MPEVQAPRQPILSIDLNADLGEGGVDDAAILQLVSSANIACGGHTGDALSMRTAVQLAIKNEVKIGAHPSFFDRTNFGRTRIHPPPVDLFDQLCRQVEALGQIVQQEGANLHHIKPHGALYNQAAQDPSLGEILIQVIKECGPAMQLIALAGSPLIEQARAAGIFVIPEAFADRRYNHDGSLRARTFHDACINNEADVLAQCLSILRDHTAQTWDNKPIRIEARTLCLHGDGPHALQLLRAIRLGLARNAIQVTAK
ncbi:5-oxoprolinase subunit PxpA [Undibacterium fentianense]|uniref:5-oxoprolinase subunit PxpA n=1 Tax=Undibacterium fentianense TaxID=2828728 RepID=A0A941DZF1_9BURK|nr:5-oxoprolinase subunit PxpA [Undibacterium fentianense]MBR7799630.1 5-oxoprolinase subunit PxpA [Undibacterium fentianense]